MYISRLFVEIKNVRCVGRCGRTAQSTTRCRISIARCSYQPIVQCILQRAVDNCQSHTLVITTRCYK